jgi:hypothetical protein
VAAPFAVTSAAVLLHLLARLTSAPDTPFIVVYALVIALVLPLAALAVVCGWIATSPDQLGKWTARLLGPLAILAQLFLVWAT